MRGRLTASAVLLVICFSTYRLIVHCRRSLVSEDAIVATYVACRWCVPRPRIERRPLGSVQKNEISAFANSAIAYAAHVVYP